MTWTPPYPPHPRSEIRQRCADDLPVVASVTPEYVVPSRGGTVTINGTGFGDVQEVYGATLLAASDDEIVISLEPGRWSARNVTIVTSRFTIDMPIVRARKRTVR